MKKITVVGLGSGDENQLTLGIWRKIQDAGAIYVRTLQHPVITFMDKNGIVMTDFDRIYEREASFPDVYEAIAAALLEAAQADGNEIIYAVPGHPSVAERTTQILRTRCAEEGVVFATMGGESFLDQAFLRFGFDPIEGFQLLDSTQINRATIQPGLHLLITQVYDSFTASEVKLGLMDIYPDDYPVVVGHRLGIEGQEKIISVPLYELDRQDDYGNLSLIWIPGSTEDQVKRTSIHRLHEIVEMLRSPEGCPWDREQTHRSLRKHLIEETWEVVETIDNDDPAAMCEELGDLLLQVLLHAQIEEEEGSFTVYDVIAELNDKLIRRHPHVFGDQSAESAEDALANWQAVKQEERKHNGSDNSRPSALDGIPRELPVLLKAWNLQKKAAAVGFDWTTIDEVIAKVEEELVELKQELIAESSEEGRIGELGDLFFTLVNLARFIKVDPEEALALTNRKFSKRFLYIEEQLRLAGKDWKHTELAEMERYWQEAKQQ